MTFADVVKSAPSWRAPGLPGAEKVLAAQCDAQKEVLRQIDRVKGELLSYKCGSKLRVVHFGEVVDKQFLMTETALSFTMFPPDIGHRTASFQDVDRLTRQIQSSVVDADASVGPIPGAVPPEEECDHSSISIESIANSLISSCKELVQAVHRFEANCADREFQLKPAVLEPIIKLIAHMTAGLDQLRCTTSATSKLLVRVSATTPAGFEAMCTTVLVTPLSSSPDIGSIQSSVRELLSAEVASRRKAESRIVSATFPFLNEEVEFIEIDNDVFVEQVDGPGGPGVLTLSFVLMNGDADPDYDYDDDDINQPPPRRFDIGLDATRLSYRPDSLDWFVEEHHRHWFLGRAGEFRYWYWYTTFLEYDQVFNASEYDQEYNAALCEESSALFLTDKSGQGDGSKSTFKYSFRAGVDAAKGALDMLEKFQEFGDLQLAVSRPPDITPQWPFGGPKCPLLGYVWDLDALKRLRAAMPNASFDGVDRAEAALTALKREQNNRFGHFLDTLDDTLTSRIQLVPYGADDVVPKGGEPLFEILSRQNADDAEFVADPTAPGNVIATLRFHIIVPAEQLVGE